VSIGTPRGRPARINQKLSQLGVFNHHLDRCPARLPNVIAMPSTEATVRRALLHPTQSRKTVEIMPQCQRSRGRIVARRCGPCPSHPRFDRGARMAGTRHVLGVAFGQGEARAMMGDQAVSRRTSVCATVGAKFGGDQALACPGDARRPTRSRRRPAGITASAMAANAGLSGS
jgi:hypothetical protein